MLTPLVASVLGDRPHLALAGQPARSRRSHRLAPYRGQAGRRRCSASPRSAHSRPRRSQSRLAEPCPRAKTRSPPPLRPGSSTAAAPGRSTTLRSAAWARARFSRRRARSDLAVTHPRIPAQSPSNAAGSSPAATHFPRRGAVAATDHVNGDGAKSSLSSPRPTRRSGKIDNHETANRSNHERGSCHRILSADDAGVSGSRAIDDARLSLGTKCRRSYSSGPLTRNRNRAIEPRLTRSPSPSCRRKPPLAPEPDPNEPVHESDQPDFRSKSVRTSRLRALARSV